MVEAPVHYPDVTDILARKAEGRRQRASLTFGEKLDILDAMRERVAPIVQAREARGEALKKVRRARNVESVSSGCRAPRNSGRHEA